MKYFDKSRSWLYHKLDGIDCSGKLTFSAQEKEQLRKAFKDLSNRIAICADNL